ncbi:MAG: Ppx/GppA phosphatase family protein [Pseudomonadota bacterium]
MDDIAKPLKKKDRAVFRSRLAVIDIGSNSIRLVIYDVYGAAMLPYINQKTMAGLGRGFGETGRLSADGRQQAMRALKRFSGIINGLGINRVRAVATAAVRMAEDGPDFVADVKRETGLDVEVLRGVDEASASAAGVKAGFPQAKGLIADLGGSSVEFGVLDGEETCLSESYPLGPLVYHSNYDRKARLARIDEALVQSKALKADLRGQTLYLIGGAWRALAKLHMDLYDYGLRFLHAYEFAAKETARLVEATHANDPVSISRVEKAGGRRADILPYAALLLDAIVRRAKTGRVVISAYGVREGLVRLETGKTSRNALLDGIELIMRPTRQQWEFGDALVKFVSPVLPKKRDLLGAKHNDGHLVKAACALSDIGARSHPNMRARLAYDTVLEGSWTGLNHQERAFLALAVGSRYTRRFRVSDAKATLLSGAQADRARQLGALMRLGATLSGRSVDLLASASLHCDKNALCLSVNRQDEHLLSETVERRLGYAAQFMQRVPKTIVHD